MTPRDDGAGLRELMAEGGDDALWKRVHDAMPTGILVVDAERRVTYLNQAAHQLLSVAPERALGRPCTEVFDCPQCSCVCRLFGEGAVDDVEVTIFTPERRRVRKSARLLRDADGQVMGGVEVLTPVARSADAAVTGCETGSAPAAEGVVALSRDLKVEGSARELAAFLGRPPYEVEGAPFFELLGARPPADADLERLAEQRRVVHIREGAGALRPVQLEFLPMRHGAEALLVRFAVEGPHGEQAQAIESDHGFAGMVGRSSAMQEVFRLVERVAASDVNVLIEGESGSGKELVARAIHDLGPRAEAPFFAVNCATFTGSLLLSELFGHERGAFTGAHARRRGKLELAAQGTLLLDEVAEIPLEHQALFLRVLESRVFERLGGQDPIRLEARVVAATNRALELAARDGDFRDDLYYRLAVVPVRLPPLRERPEDIPLLVDHMMAKKGLGARAPRLAPSALAALEAHPWPGNVRELRNLLDYLVFAVEGDEVRLEHLPPSFLRRSALDLPRPAAPPVTATATGVRTVPTGERARILDALESTRWAKARAAKKLGMDRTTLWRKMKRLGLDEPT